VQVTGQFKFLPLGSILDSYLGRGFLRIFFLSLLCCTSLFVIVEFFDRIGAFLDTGAPMTTLIRYFFYKVPLAVSRVIGFATLFSTLFCMGMLARTQEITAMRSNGLRLQRIALPILLLSLLISIFAFAWNEGIVPVFTHRAQTIYKTEVKKRQQQSLYGTHDIWIRGKDSFVNIDAFDVKTNTLEGITIFLLNRDFSLRGLVDIASAHWNGRGWESKGATEWVLAPDGKMFKERFDGSPPISETPEDLKLLARDADEFSYFDLQKQISDMRSKGIDTTSYEVDLQIKLAIPFVSPLMVLLAIPFALKKQFGGGMALSFGIAMLIGFGYFVLTAFCISLGHGGALPPVIAAWLPNSIFALIGLYFFTAEE
jgi:lipopolysaccharide export system permease protein